MQKDAGTYRIMMNPYQQHGKATDAVHFGEIKAFFLQSWFGMPCG
jgi:hypothetical protein